MRLIQQKGPSPTSLGEDRHGRDKPPPKCRWGAFENPQFRWEPKAHEEQSPKESESVPYGFSVGSPKGPPRIEHGRGLAWLDQTNSMYPHTGRLSSGDRPNPTFDQVGKPGQGRPSGRSGRSD